MASRVALVMAPLLPGIRMGVGNNGLENGGGEKLGPPGVNSQILNQSHRHLVTCYLVLQYLFSLVSYS